MATLFDQLMQRAGDALRSNRLDDAAGLVEQAIRADENRAEAWHFLAGIRLRQQQRTEAAVALHKVIELDPTHRAAGLDLARVLRELERDEERLALCRALVGRWPDDLAALRELALSCWELGDLDGAAAAFRRALELNPSDADTLYDLTLMGRSDLVSPASVRAALDDPSLTWMREARLHFALGKLAENDQCYDAAFAHFAEGNRIRRAHEDFGVARKLGNANAFLELFDRVDGLQGKGCSSRRPVFVTGLPRSGTTLVAQILNSHPRIENLGERRDLQNVVSRWARRAGAGHLLERLEALESDVWARMGEDYLARLPERGSGIEHQVDKMPFNVNLVGFIRCMFPDAPVIICRRDLRDAAVSCFSTCFSETAFSYDLFELGQFAGMCEGLSAYWQERWPDHVHVVDYEELVTEPEPVVRRLFHRIGVNFNEDWRAFHSADTPVRTASISQVRRSIHRGSVGRWKHYEEHLEALMAGIADARGRFGNKSRITG